MKLNHSGNGLTGKPLVMIMEKPDKAVMEARVMMKVGTLNLFLISPARTPKEKPVARVVTPAMVIAAGRLKPAAASFLVSTAVSDPAKATAEPTLRSISPEMITMVMPKAMMPCMEVFRRTFSTLFMVAKPGAVKANSTHRATRIASRM